MNSSVFFSLSLKCNEPSDTQNSDALSTSSDLLNLLLNEDLCSATGSALSGSGASATSDSLGSSSLGCDVSRSGAGTLLPGYNGAHLDGSHRIVCPSTCAQGWHYPATLQVALSHGGAHTLMHSS